jgi:hypothetical protein
MATLLRSACLSILFLVAGATSASAQMEWTFESERTLTFPASDTLVGPYLGTFDASGNLWVISSAEDSLYRNVYVNALFRLSPGETVFTKVDDYTETSVRAPNGVTAIGSDIYVSSRVFMATDPYYAESMIMRYPNGDVNQRTSFTTQSTGGQDYGSWVSGIAATRDGYILAGRAWLMSIVSFDFRENASVPGEYLGTAGDGETWMEPGGQFDGWGSDLIREVALIPDGDYSDPSTPFYTTRNSSMYNAGSQSGGIALWSGGTQSDLAGYSPVRVEDFAGTLSLGPTHPYGIAVDGEGYLYVAGTDQGRRHVKVFEVDMESGFAMEVGNLPSSTTSLEFERDPDGAPFEEPADVILSTDGTTAYVVDRRAQSVFVFTRQGTVSNEPDEHPVGFTLDQNYPNPFNPSTTIVFTLGVESLARLTILDVLGREVATLHDGQLTSGQHEVVFDATGLPSGVYLYRLETPSGSAVRAMQVLK